MRKDEHIFLSPEPRQNESHHEGMGTGLWWGRSYLAWQHMDWKIVGEAKMEKFSLTEPCQKSPSVTLIPFEPMPSMDACMEHCQKLQTRSPSVVSLEEWDGLNTELKYHIQIQNYGYWLSLTDRVEEGVWRDWYTGQQANYSLPFTGSGPNGGES